MRWPRRETLIPLALGALAFVVAFVQRPGLEVAETKVDLHVAPGAPPMIRILCANWQNPDDAALERQHFPGVECKRSTEYSATGSGPVLSASMWASSCYDSEPSPNGDRWRVRSRTNCSRAQTN